MNSIKRVVVLGSVIAAVVGLTACGNEQEKRINQVAECSGAFIAAQNVLGETGGSFAGSLLLVGAYNAAGEINYSTDRVDAVAKAAYDKYSKNPAKIPAKITECQALLNLNNQ